MIVDLMRNDLGRFAEAGSVEVRGFPSLLELPHVFHLFAEVRAKREEGLSPWEILLGAFPPGSIVGAPKPRALEILESLERSRRGVYTGSIGWMDSAFRGRWNVAIRTLTYDEGELCFGVGGGITALSDPQSEWEETVNKARGFARMLGWKEAL
jgi:anthranilate/para-aminobenzoate synthase component I